ncbi:MAG: GFA family protein [Polyangiaceae bacterium]|nr:GFA family protein [Polyangiaceae bacterium]
MTERTASCSCGKLTITTRGEPIRISICHCLDCQRRTGSVFGAQARFPKDAVQIAGDSTCYVRTADSGNKIRFNFCPACGSTVYYQLDALPDAIAVPIGAFADPTFPSPKVSIYEARRHAWAGVPEDAEHLD